MIKLTEILASIYIDKMEKLISEINWDILGNRHRDTQTSIKNIINNIKNIHNYEGESAVKYLKELKNQAKAALYVLNNLLENQNNK